MRIRNNTPRRGEVWLVNLDPTVGDEIRKTRPAVVVSSDALGSLRVKLIAPLTDWKVWYDNNAWLVRIDPTKQNGLTKPSAADTLQVRGVSIDRFIERLGVVSPMALQEIAAAIAIVVEFE